MNRVELVGNVGSDPELRFSDNGRARAMFSLATTEGEGDNAKTLWHRVTVFDGPNSMQAQNVADTVKKGARVAVIGRLDQYTRELFDDAGQAAKVTVTNVIAQEVAVGLLTQRANVTKVRRDGSPADTSGVEAEPVSPGRTASRSGAGPRQPAGVAAGRGRAAEQTSADAPF